MLDLSSSETQLFIRSSQVDTVDDSELDTIDFGVVALDADGVVLRYNLYESRLARLDRNQVLGRNFFTDVAPCTRCEEFEGRFRHVVATGDRVQFEFLFDFRFGAQKVAVEIISIPGGDRYYLLINRRAILPARPDLPASSYAVLQRDLAPDEAQLGVRRGPEEQRLIELPWSWLAALRATCKRLAPDTWQLFCSEWGGEWGRRAAQELETTAMQTQSTPLHEQPMRDVANLISDHFFQEGWGLMRFDFGAAHEGLIVAEVERSALAELGAQQRGPSESSSELACHLLAGCLGSLMSQIGARRLTVREVSCKAGGASRCTFVVVAEPRRNALEAALAQGVRGLEKIRAAVRSALPAARDR